MVERLAEIDRRLSQGCTAEEARKLLDERDQLMGIAQLQEQEKLMTLSLLVKRLQAGEREALRLTAGQCAEVRKTLGSTLSAIVDSQLCYWISKLLVLHFRFLCSKEELSIKAIEGVLKKNWSEDPYDEILTFGRPITEEVRTLHQKQKRRLMEIYAAVNAVREERAGDAEDKLLDSQLALSDPIAIGRELQEWLEDNDLVAEAVVSREKLRSPRKIIQEEVEELPERKGAEKRKRKEKEEDEAEVLKGSVSPSALREPAKVIGKLAPEVERWLAEESKSPKTVERISSEEREEHPPSKRRQLNDLREKSAQLRKRGEDPLREAEEVADKAQPHEELPEMPSEEEGEEGEQLPEPKQLPSPQSELLRKEKRGKSKEEESWEESESVKKRRLSTKMTLPTRPRKGRILWKNSEVEKLVEGIAKHGYGKWAQIAKDFFAAEGLRNSVDLKDKMRVWARQGLVGFREMVLDLNEQGRLSNKNPEAFIADIKDTLYNKRVIGRPASQLLQRPADELTSEEEQHAEEESSQRRKADQDKEKQEKEKKDVEVEQKEEQEKEKAKHKEMEAGAPAMRSRGETAKRDTKKARKDDYDSDEILV